MHGDRIAGEGGRNEPGNRELLAHPGTVRNAIPEDRELLPVQLEAAAYDELGSSFDAV